MLAEDMQLVSKKESAEGYALIYKILEDALKNPISYGVFRLEFTFTNFKLTRWKSSKEESRLLE
jgi:hypothetical protein